MTEHCNNLKLSVVIPTHQRPRQLSALLTSIAQVRPSAVYEIIVVSNLEDMVSKRIVGSHPSVRYLVSGAVGVNRARNLGLRSSRGNVVLFLDDDCVVLDPAFFDHHLFAHKREPWVTAVGGTYQIAGPSNLWGRIYHRLALGWLTEIAEANGSTWSLLGGNVSFKRKMLEVGQLEFDPEISFGGAETEFLLRLKNKGHTLHLDPAITIGHGAHLTLIEFLTKAVRQGMGEAKRVAQKNLTPVGSLRPRQRSINWIYGFAFEVGRRLSEAEVQPTLGALGVASLKTFFRGLVAWRRGPKIIRWINLIRMSIEHREWIRAQPASGGPPIDPTVGPKSP